MSSGNLLQGRNPELFRWSAELDASAYLFARYELGSVHDGEATAMAMAMEQSAATTRIEGYVEPAMLTEWTIRVCDVTRVQSFGGCALEPYQLDTEVYAGNAKLEQLWSITLAIPLRLLAGKPAQLFNVIIGELPRLGFLTRFRLERCELPSQFGPGPAFGVAGLRERFAVPRGPFLCRSMRPAVGLDATTMARLNADVLTGGFHLVKDDELMVFADNEVFRRHLQRMLQARERARDLSGEKKGYIANLICEPDELAPRLDIACALGVDAVLVAPFIQGFGSLAWLAKQGQLPLLSHNSSGDFFSRHPAWGISHAVLAAWQQGLGADWFVTSGAFGVDGSETGIPGETAGGGTPARQAMPIVQGGKHPEGLPGYRAAVGNDDYMLIVASWVDAHPGGLGAAAREFRDAVDQQHAAPSPTRQSPAIGLP